MRHGFLDRHTDLDSPLHRLDPRVKLVVALSGILLASSETAGVTAPFVGYYAIGLTLALLSRVPLRHFLSRFAVASPFILTASSLPLVAVWLEGRSEVEFALAWSASVALKAYFGILMLALLTSTSDFADLLDAMRRLHVPEIIGILATLMYRHMFTLADEWSRMSQARDCRSAGRLMQGRVSVYGKQLGQAFLRSWERSDRVHGAMVLRGFEGTLPARDRAALNGLEWGLLALGCAVFVAIRFARPV